jgi:sugar lactone lactonase YvrE
MNATLWWLVLAGAGLCAGCGGPDSASTGGPAAPTLTPSDIPDVIVAARGGFVPEGIEYDRTNGRFLTGSLPEGSIFEVGLDGSVTAFVTDDALVSSVGIEVDEDRGRLLVTNSDFSIFQGSGSGQAMLGVYDLGSGDRIAMLDMGATVGDVPEGSVFFANDVTVGADGTAYATDTRMNVIYAVDTDYEPSLFFRFPATQGLALNGIEFHPDGYLLVADSGNGAIYKVPVDNPEAGWMVELPEPMAGADGIVWRRDGALAVVRNAAEGGGVTALVSNDDWISARILDVAPHEGQATTGAAVGDDIFVVQPHFNDQDPPRIRRAIVQ